jgi:hypothetical protein
VAGFLTPTHLLLLLAALAAFVVLGRMTRGDAREGAAAHGRRARRRLLDFRLRKPTRREVHIGWLVASALVAFALTRAVALPLFLFVFVVLWLAGFGVLWRLYR